MCLGIQKNRLNETVLLKTHDICFGRLKRKIKLLIMEAGLSQLFWDLETSIIITCLWESIHISFINS